VRLLRALSEVTMLRLDKYAAFAFAALAFALTTLPSYQAGSEDVDYSNEVHSVIFAPLGGRPLALRTTDGQWIGYSKGAPKLQVNIDGNTFRRSIDPKTGAIDVPTLLSQLSPRKGDDGSIYFSMKVVKPIVLDDGREIEPATDEQMSEVLLNVDDFKIILQPNEAQSQDQTPPSKKVTKTWNETLQTNGVTPATRPGNAANAETDNLDIPVPAQNDGEDDDDEPYTPANAVGMDRYGSPFPTQIFSSPVCGCKGGTCGLGDTFGPRGKIDKHGKCISKKTLNGKHISCHHKGWDITTSAKVIGTPVLAAADGCFKVPQKKNRHGVRYKTGDLILKSDLLESGYGYTVRLTHGNGIETQYSHLSAISPTLRWGMCVKRGDRLGKMGKSGNSTGPHLHFGVAVNRTPVDPRPYMLGSTGNFLSPSCSDLPKHGDIDLEMVNDLRNSVRQQAPVVRAGRRVRTTTHKRARSAT
jgi:murein DD-endopeptidase MepM/ murein hydrolase activator NlpD